MGKRVIISIRIRVLKVQIGQIKYERFTSPNNFELDEKLLKAWTTAKISLTNHVKPYEEGIKMIHIKPQESLATNNT